ncbi:hypothetical protein ACO22_03070 [Paracoccidioides brasiliensis]|uniref:Uncharacterized protein n=1 Tax=Paracoccidioides brasiliensis TaxID=121759 RepID=A0A1D2JH11_PARBR|nr:hypothetical protein ACO22_03070 [Paracoccidioides brasiliensis]
MPSFSLQVHTIRDSSLDDTARKSLWTDEEEMWLIVTCMEQHTNEWLAQNMPGNSGRTSHSIAGHLADLRTKGKLPRSWRQENGNGVTSWSIAEDMEILEWILHAKTRIDPVVFVAADRSGTAITNRAEYLMADEVFAALVHDTEESLRLVQLNYDATEEGPEKEEAYDILVIAEDDSDRLIRDALQKSLASRS